METAVRRANLVLAAVVALVLTAGALIGFAVWLRASFGVWGVSSVPERIPLCDQSYSRADDRVLTYAEAVGPGADASPIVLEPTVGSLPLSVAPPARYDPGLGYHGCGHLALLHVGDDRYVRYFKLGGP